MKVDRISVCDGEVHYGTVKIIAPARLKIDLPGSGCYVGLDITDTTIETDDGLQIQYTGKDLICLRHHQGKKFEVCHD